MGASIVTKPVPHITRVEPDAIMPGVPVTADPGCSCRPSGRQDAAFLLKTLMEPRSWHIWIYFPYGLPIVEFSKSAYVARGACHQKIERGRRRYRPNPTDDQSAELRDPERLAQLEAPKKYSVIAHSAGGAASASTSVIFVFQWASRKRT